MKYKVGDKVILLSKFGDKDFIDSSLIYRIMLSKNQPYGYITEVRENEEYLVNYKSGFVTGDYYLESDLKPYIIEERRLKLKKLKWSR